MGPLGGIIQSVPFATYDAILREAITSTSPFYRLLCAFRIYEGTSVIRRGIRQECERLGINERMPADPEVNQNELVGFAFAPEIARNIRRASDLFESLRVYRNAISHFLIEGDEGDAHVYLADGEMMRGYSIAAAAALRYAQLTVNSLRAFYVAHLERRIGARGMVLPLPQQRDAYIVRDPEE